jgi:carboxymethylenebutenolidase
MTKSTIEIKTADGNFSAYIAKPEKTPAPVVILIQEIFGINEDMRHKCNHLAGLGYIAVAPDLFWRIEPGISLTDKIPEELQRAFHLFSIFDQIQGLEDLKATLDTVRHMDGSNGKVGCVGYCLGGKLAFMMSTETDIDAAISYYGVGIEGLLGSAHQIKNPLMLHIAGNDQFVPKDAQEQITAALLDVEPAKAHIYVGMDHAFARENGIHYNAQAAKLANARTEEFLSSALKASKH